ncbi:MAG: hypothetical protein NT105_07110 [Verrucomicrobia bacterium]|nr:hypothetical protein [Verrucomicrobiota bacterium]
MRATGNWLAVARRDLVLASGPYHPNNTEPDGVPAKSHIVLSAEAKGKR